MDDCYIFSLADDTDVTQSHNAIASLHSAVRTVPVEHSALLSTQHDTDRPGDGVNNSTDQTFSLDGRSFSLLNPFCEYLTNNH